MTQPLHICEFVSGLEGIILTRAPWLGGSRFKCLTSSDSLPGPAGPGLKLGQLSPLPLRNELLDFLSQDQHDMGQICVRLRDDAKTLANWSGNLPCPVELKPPLPC